ncbi:hypothetical protein [Planctomicrobium piriforme]|uniref:Methyltransferase domain-containing protein n=1 Tax=Planctomicrobium piriforme TaxID=1576369 RepID=A0A1I3H358_9PLAN|nr:hypothetical protein [Planctomicrobium piriforme]SFI29977.1 hypothetical protein SAMN05421753_107227 [Planctomicrobium piriforme]
MGSAPAVKEFDIECFFASEVRAFTDALASLERRIPASKEPEADEFLAEMTAAIHGSRDACEAAEMAIGPDAALLLEAQKRFREQIGPWFDRSWFMQRAKAKPRGYPGDFEMLTAIYDGQPKATGFGGYLDLYFLGTDLARAVCSRLDSIQKFLVREVLQRTTRVSVLNVASGPGREYSHGFEPPETMQLTCVDTDEQALAYLRSHVDPQASDALDLNCVCYNALKMTSSKTNIARFGQPDMIYSVGLCDYIPDRYLIRILNGWRESVGEDGIVYVAFKDAPRYHAAEYQWHVDWHFYQRTETDCRKLFAEAGYDVDSMEMFRDSTGIIMNFVARQNAIQNRRFDAAERLRGPHVRMQPQAAVLEPDVEPSEL